MLLNTVVWKFYLYPDKGPFQILMVFGSDNYKKVLAAERLYTARLSDLQHQSIKSFECLAHRVISLETSQRTVAAEVLVPCSGKVSRVNLRSLVLTGRGDLENT